jgi:hypothetical protein
VPQLATGLLRRPPLRCPQPRLRGLRLATADGPGAAQHSTAAVHATAAEHSAAAQHSAATEHPRPRPGLRGLVDAAGAHDGSSADELVAEADNTERPDDVDAGGVPRLVHELHSRA